MNFLIFREFSRIFLNFSKFILDLFQFYKNKSYHFLSLVDVAVDAASVCTRHVAMYVYRHVCACVRVQARARAGVCVCECN